MQTAGQGGASALVDGRIVRIGDRLAELTVTAIDAQGIVVRGAHGEQRLALVTRVTKTSSAMAPPHQRPALNVATKDSP